MCAWKCEPQHRSDFFSVSIYAKRLKKGNSWRPVWKCRDHHHHSPADQPVLNKSSYLVPEKRTSASFYPYISIYTDKNAKLPSVSENANIKTILFSHLHLKQKKQKKASHVAPVKPWLSLPPFMLRLAPHQNRLSVSDPRSTLPRTGHGSIYKACPVRRHIIRSLVPACTLHRGGHVWP